MIKDNQISNEEIKDPKTGDDLGVSDEKTTSKIPEDLEKSGIESISAEENIVRSLNPLEVAKKNHYEKEAKKNTAKTKLINVLTTCIKGLSITIGILLTIVAVYLAYFITSISEPMGGLKESVKTIETDNKSLNDSVKNLEKKLIETREEFLKSNIKK